MNERIIEELYKIENENHVRILYAVESGSRAWGFASVDSDYDVRFIYIHRVEWYLSIREKRDVIECPVTDFLDISGWDIRKVLRLFMKSNPPLLEWLQSPIVYVEKYSFAASLHRMVKQYFSPLSCMYHYLHMAKGNYREYLKGDMVKTKKYFYVLRPVLACKWIENNKTVPPVEFEKLLYSQVEDEGIRREIEKLLTRKREGEELDYEPAIPILNEYLNSMIEYYSDYVERLDKSPAPDEGKLDELFRNALKEVWL